MLLENPIEMWSYKLTFKSISGNLSFLVESENEELIDQFVYGFFKIFGDVVAKKIEVHQINDIVTRTKVIEHIELFRDKFPPTINQITSFFNRLDENEVFLFIPEIDLTIEINYRLHNYLLSLKTNQSIESLNANFESVFGKVLANYDIDPYGSIRRFIGSKKTFPQVCRFCGLDNLKTTFNQTAHVISEGLGNKKLFTYEECDICNEKFSRELEPDIINSYSIFRTLFGVKAKGGSKKMKGKEFEILYDEQPIIKFSNINHRPNFKDKSYKLKLDLLEKVNSQDVYRSLSKFVISVIDRKYLKEFKETIKWINKELSFETLPKIAELISYHTFSKEPKLFVYIRKNDNMDLPFIVGEFHFTCKISTFIIPLSANDNRKFIDESEYQFFWDNFVNYNKSESWVFNDYSNDNEREFRFNLDFQLPDKN